MKRIFITMGAALIGLSAMAAERVLYSQNFENVSTPQEAGWSFGGDAMTIASDEEGKYLVLSLGGSNSRSGMVTWGSDIYLNDNGESVLEEGIYNVGFDFSFTKVPDKDHNTDLTIFTNHAPVGNQPYRTPWNPAGGWNNFVFDLYEFSAENDITAGINAPLVVTENEDGSKSYSVDSSDSKTVSTGAWYKVKCTVNVNTRNVEYSVESTTGDLLASGEFTVPEYDANGDVISMYAEGFNAFLSRYKTEVCLDNIKIWYDSSQDYANPPTVALTRLGKNAEDQLDLNMRAYLITYLDGETLHVTGTDGNTIEAEYADYDGGYIYETTQSGVMKAWTTMGTATSEVIETQVDCTPYVLPGASAAITAVEEGFGKTYTLTVDNADVPLRPTIFINYEFKGKDGSVISQNELTSGAKVTVPSEGELTITTEAFGYQANKVTVTNNIRYDIKKEYDFARMSKEDYISKGFGATWETTNSDVMNGWTNWTARHRLFYYDVNQPTGEVDDAGNPIYAQVFPFGFISADNTTNVLESCGIEADVNTAEAEIFEGIKVYAGYNLTAILHVGVTSNQGGRPDNRNIDIHNLAPTDVVVANKINGYGGNSCHPIVATVEEYYAQLAGDNEVYLPVEDTEKVGEETVGLGTYSVSIPVYRIDTTCAKLTIYAQGESDAVEGVEAEVIGDNYYYTIDGLRVAEPTRPGLYIHNGKKIIVK